MFYSRFPQKLCMQPPEKNPHLVHSCGKSVITLESSNDELTAAVVYFQYGHNESARIVRQLFGIVGQSRSSVILNMSFNQFV